LYLSGNDLTNVQFLNSAQNLFRLRIVDISDNRIFRLETFGFGALSNLQFLSIENNFLSMMLPSAFNGTALKVLNLRRNRLQAVDSVVFGGVEGSLTAVDLSYNVLRRVHDFRKFSALEKMNLSSNTIVDFASK
jgi:Leucine-rich repeat (LRR) protein